MALTGAFMARDGCLLHCQSTQGWPHGGVKGVAQGPRGNSWLHQDPKQGAEDKPGERRAPQGPPLHQELQAVRMGDGQEPCPTRRLRSWSQGCLWHR